MTVDALLARNGGNLRFRILYVALKRKPTDALMHGKCECCDTQATQQVVGVFGRRGRKIVPVQWTWICEACAEAARAASAAK
jgi:hypothetical protein